MKSSKDIVSGKVPVSVQFHREPLEYKLPFRVYPNLRHRSWTFIFPHQQSLAKSHTGGYKLLGF